jgi:glyoxylase-like metal-dependent hydrolase (beta-lactamase superfamily II)
VEHRLRDREVIHWKNFTLTAFDFPGQTLYHAGLLVERDGFKVFFTGDCFSSRSFSDVCSQNRNFSGRHAGFEKCCRILLETKPDILMAAHWGPLAMSREYTEKFIQYLEARAKLYARLFPYADAVNFGTDPYWLRVYPFRQQAAAGSPAEVEAVILNHGRRPMRARVSLALPAEWKQVRGDGEVTVAPGAEGRVRFRATAPVGPGRRHVLGLRAIIDGRHMGECASAIVDLV